jgi:acetylornithine deacetylase/succinyl-diaminopimelate desuccinylase-like protein
MSELTGETTELLQALIRNGCVNDGTPESGDETRSAELLEQFLAGSGLEVQRFSPDDLPGRASLVARIEGSDPDAPALCLMGHTDVVPVNPAGWREDPFGGELIEGEVWGRGAVDMLNLTASMAVAFRHLARRGFQPKGSLIFFAVADEEAGGTCGAKWMVDEHWDAIRCDYVLTELGGWTVPSADGTHRVAVTVAEKGLAWRRIRVSGTPGHGSMPYLADNALVKAAEVVRRLAEYRPAPRIDDLWRAQVEVMDLDPELKAGLLDPARLWGAIQQLPVQQARLCQALTHTTFSPNVAHGGQKTNTIPDEVVLEVDVRTVPGDGHEEVEAHLRQALGPLYDEVRVEALFDDVASVSAPESPLWDVLRRGTQAAFPGAELLPGMIMGATDARFFRDKGAIALGAGLFSPSITFESFGSRFHGNDERIDVESLGLATDLWLGVCRELLG